MTFSLRLVCLVLGVASAAAGAESLLIEAEDFQFQGAWARVSDAACSGRYMLQVFPAATRREPLYDAVTAFSADAPGDYTFWALARDFPSDRPGTRRFALAVDGTRLETEAGNHGKEGFIWQALGSRPLTAGTHLLALQDTTHGYGRCDAVFVTRGASKPGEMTPQQRARLRTKPVPLASEEPAAFRSPTLTRSADAPLATLESKTMRVAFRTASSADGRAWIVRSVHLRVGEAWLPIPDAAGQEALFVLRAESVVADLLRVATWQGARVPVDLAFNGVRTRTCTAGADPYTSAPATRFVPSELVASDAVSADLLYRSADGQTLPVRWSLDSDDPYTLRAQARFTAPTAASYSLGFSALQETDRDNVQFVQLPPLYQFQRLPASPDLLCNTLTPHPLALAQLPWQTNGAPLCVAVIAEPADLPFVWPDATNAVCGFALLNSRARVQPTFFSPVLGSPRSRLEAGATRVINWRVMTRPAEWKTTLEAAVANIMQVTDYREPINASLTDAALNMVDLMLSDEFGGWNADLRGFYDIESATMGKHAAPLALLSAATLTRSETFWASRALPTLEFLLSRKRSDLLQNGVTRDGQPIRNQLRVPTDFYGTTCWEGLSRLTRGLNPWLGELAFSDGKVRHAQAYNASWPWTERLAGYRLNPTLAPLSEATANADVWLAKEVYGRQTRPVDYECFYNIHFYPYWWDLLDLYEATHEARYLAAAEEGAFHTIAGQWSHPRVLAGDVTLHPGGLQVTYHPVWHKNDQLFRLGWPRQPNDTPEHAVPAWQVSPVGLGLEQPSTYTCFRGAMNNIMQSTWAPHLLRVYRHTGREIYRTFARNSVIGRFANYPGYYLTCFTDRVHDPRYPYTGPDITSLYYHHIPVHYAFTMDYLLADAEARSGGMIAFPWVKQKNYAWFNNRVYSAEPGRVYDDTKAVLWVERGLVTTGDAKTDWLAARSPDRFWVMLMNQTRATNTVTATIDTAKAGLLPEGTGVLHRGDSGPLLAAEKGSHPAVAPELKNGTLTVTIPPLSLVTLGYPAAPREEFPASAPLAAAHQSADAGAFGQAHAFTIRSPWGKDARYAVLTADAIPGAKVTFTCEGVERVCERFPYEASFYPVATPAAPVRVTALVPGGTAKVIELR